MRQFRRSLATILSMGCLTGCAHISVDADGTRRVIGLVALTLPPAAQDAGADVLRVRSLGLTLARAPVAGGHATLGFSDVTIAAMRNDSAVSRLAIRRAAGRDGPEEGDR